MLVKHIFQAAPTWWIVSAETFWSETESHFLYSVLSMLWISWHWCCSGGTSQTSPNPKQEIKTNQVNLFCEFRSRVNQSIRYSATCWSSGKFTSLLAMIALSAIKSCAQTFITAHVFTRVCDSVHRRGGLLHCMLGYTPLGPEAGTPQDQASPSAVHAGRYGQQVGGAHPTGMQSCSQCYYVHWHLQYLIQSSSLVNRDAILII